MGLKSVFMYAKLCIHEIEIIHSHKYNKHLSICLNRDK